MEVQGVITKQGTDISKTINDLAGDNAVAFLGMIIAESNLDELSIRRGTWPDYSGGLTHVTASNLGYVQGNLAAYEDFVYNPVRALKAGWKYFAAALMRTEHQPLLSILSYNIGPVATQWTLATRVQTAGTKEQQRMGHIAISYDKATKYAVDKYISPLAYVTDYGYTALIEVANELKRVHDQYI